MYTVYPCYGNLDPKPYLLIILKLNLHVLAATQFFLGGILTGSTFLPARLWGLGGVNICTIVGIHAYVYVCVYGNIWGSTPYSTSK